MDKNGFENVIVEFAPKLESLKQLAHEVRNVLFPIRDRAIFTGTFRDHDVMYDGMIKAFNRAIGPLGKEEELITMARPSLAISKYCEATSIFN
jgi:hypothetical protein